ncbi:MAG: prepilin-type N-terminal cleavage/methylation domain-containing protein [Minisyncoccia bacterium]
MKTKKKSKKKGFTLIELLIVIAIIAILSVVVVLTLNPAEMLRRSRDSNRASDLSIIKTSISLYLADVSSTSMGASATCYIGLLAGQSSAALWEAPSSSPTVASQANCVQWFNSAPTLESSSSNRGVNGTTTIAGVGWIPINLSLVSSGAPIGQWPIDPSTAPGTSATNAGHFYSYVPGASNNAYKLAAKMESTLYSNGGSGDLESTDGGVDPYMYEQGTNLAL